MLVVVANIRLLIANAYSRRPLWLVVALKACLLVYARAYVFTCVSSHILSQIVAIVLRHVSSLHIGPRSRVVQCRALINYAEQHSHRTHKHTHARARPTTFRGLTFCHCLCFASGFDYVLKIFCVFIIATLGHCGVARVD